MVIKVVMFKSALSEPEVMRAIEARAPEYREMPGLLQKYYVKDPHTGDYGGIYLWDSPEAMRQFEDSLLYKTIPEAYRVVGRPRVEVLDVVYTLRPEKK
jgi:heme-degrading monooxygenase HmoA